MAMVLAAALLTGSASALFGKKEETPQSTEGTPVVRDLEIRTYTGRHRWRPGLFR